MVDACRLEIIHLSISGRQFIYIHYIMFAQIFTLIAKYNYLFYQLLYLFSV